VAKLGLNYPDKIWGDLGKIWGPLPPGPNAKPPLKIMPINFRLQVQNPQTVGNF